MNILLIEPAKAPVTIGGEDVFLYEPLALEYVAAGVVRDHAVRILDLRLDKDLSGTLETFRPDVVGLTAYTVHVNTVRQLCDEIKRWNPRVLTVVGGHHATVMPEDFLSPAIDLIVMGEGVSAFREIVARFGEGQGFEGIPGVARASNGGLVKAHRTTELDLDALPFPERGLTAQYRTSYYSEWMKPLASIRTSKGCPFRCKFCALWKVAGGRYLKRAPERIVEELATIDEEYVFFADDESLIDARRMSRLAAAIREAGIKKRYFLYGRSDTIVKHPDLLEEWRDIGLEQVFVGLEFFRDSDLVEIHKGSTIADNRRAVEILHGLGIEIYASFIVHPQFTKDDFDAFRRYCHDLEVSYATFAVLTPLPGTDFYEEVKDQLLTHNYDLFDFLHTLLPTRLPLKEFYREYARLLQGALTPKMRLALLRKYPLRDLPSFLIQGIKVYRRLARAYLDYEIDGAFEQPSDTTP